MQKANSASVPRSERILGRSDCLTTDAVGDIVRITGAKVGNRFQVARIDISLAADPPAAGIIIKKPVAGGTDCVVQFDGPMRGTYTSLTPHAAYVVGTDGRLAKTGDANFPAATDPLQQVGEATSTDELLINLSVSRSQTDLDEKVKVSANDTTADHLLAKLVAGTGITLAELNDGGNEQVEITGSAAWTEDEFTPTLGQITFFLSIAPSDLNSFSLHVNGIAYDDGLDFTVSGTTLTWLNTPFSLDAADKLLARYQ